MVAMVETAPAFNLSYQPNGISTHWAVTTPNLSVPTNSFDRNTKAIRYYIASDAYSTTNTTNEINAVRNSFGQWQSVPNTVVKFEEAGFAPPGYDVNTSDGSNVVYWAKSSTLVDGGTSDISGALAVTFKTWYSSGSIDQFDIVVNGVQYGWFTDFNDKTNPKIFIEGTMCHEIGHALGLVHSSMGGASLMWVGQSGVDTQAGLSVDEVAFARTLYPSSNILSTLGTVKGTITKGGLPVLGAAVVVEGTNGIVAGSSVSLTNGTYILTALPPGTYNVRVTPLDNFSATESLIRPEDITSPEFDSADTSFLPSGSTQVTLTAGTTNTVNIAVTNAVPVFRITNIRKPTSNSGSYSLIPLPITMSPGQSNYTFGIFSGTLPTNGATLTVSGDGLTIGSPTYQPGAPFAGLNGISATISVSSNATPGLRTIKVTQGTNIAYANGFFEVLPLVADYNFDGLDDVFQRKYFFPFTSTNAAPNADPDNDGMNNTAENIAGTDPTSSSSLLKITSIKRATNGTTVAWQSVTNRHYQVMSRTNLSTATWTNVGSVVTPAGTNTQFLDASALGTMKFYRVQVLP
jgi:hypothetical protein